MTNIASGTSQQTQVLITLVDRAGLGLGHGLGLIMTLIAHMESRDHLLFAGGCRGRSCPSLP